MDLDLYKPPTVSLLFKSDNPLAGKDHLWTLYPLQYFSAVKIRHGFWVNLNFGSFLEDVCTVKTPTRKPHEPCIFGLWCDEIHKKKRYWNPIGAVEQSLIISTNGSLLVFAAWVLVPRQTLWNSLVTNHHQTKFFTED